MKWWWPKNNNNDDQRIHKWGITALLKIRYLYWEESKKHKNGEEVENIDIINF